jgi:UDP-2-acetamido-2,6-beta-L-arabino-hexul-4-ose reductase
MKILITGAKGFVGKNLVENLKNIRDGKDRVHKFPSDLEILEYDIDNTEAELEEFCKKADFVFNLAGVNRPKDNSEFMEGNFGFGEKLLNLLKKYKNNCPVMLSSSVQATLEGRYAGSEYGKSKLAGEKLFKDYGKETGAKREIVLLNAGATLYIGGVAESIESGVKLAAETIDSGKAMKKLEELVRVSNS